VAAATPPARETAPVSRAGYRSVLRAPGVRWLLGTSLVARLPAAMTSLGIILRVSHGTGSYAAAGVVSAAFVVGAAAFGPVLGRLADRLGRRPVLLGASVTNAVGLVALSRVPTADTAILLVASALAGASSPPVAASVRSLWPALVGAAERDALYAVDSTLQELTFVVGPALVAIIDGAFGSAAPLVASGALGLAGTVALVSRSVITTETERHPRGTSARVLSRPFLVLTGTIALLLLAFGSLEIGVVAFAGARHAAGQAGLLLGVWSAGSLLGGVAFGTRATAGGARSLPGLLSACAGGFALLAATPDVSVLYVLLLVAGIAIAPSLGCIYGLAGRLAPTGAVVEAFSWISSGILVGAAAGTAAGGLVVQHFGSRVDFIGATLAALAAAAAALALERLAPPVHDGDARSPRSAGSSRSTGA